MYYCTSCGEEVAEKRWNLGYHICLECGDKKAKKVVRTIVPMHKGNYVPVSNKEALKGINSKYVPMN